MLVKPCTSSKKKRRHDSLGEHCPIRSRSALPGAPPLRFRPTRSEYRLEACGGLPRPRAQGHGAWWGHLGVGPGLDRLVARATQASAVHRELGRRLDRPIFLTRVGLTPIRALISLFMVARLFSVATCTPNVGRWSSGLCRLGRGANGSRRWLSGRRSHRPSLRRRPDPELRLGTGTASALRLGTLPLRGRCRCGATGGGCTCCPGVSVPAWEPVEDACP